MKRFIQQFGEKITGVLSGLDRVRFRGTLLGMVKTGGVIYCLRAFGNELKDFGRWAQTQTKRIKEAAIEVAKAAGRPVIHVQTHAESKEDIAKGIAARDGIKEGLICVLTAMEIGMNYELLKSQKNSKLL